MTNSPGRCAGAGYVVATLLLFGGFPSLGAQERLPPQAGSGAMDLPDAPSHGLRAPGFELGFEPSLEPGLDLSIRQEDQRAKPGSAKPDSDSGKDDPVPLELRQPKRILGFMPNFRSVSGGTRPPPPGWKYNFKIATRQSTDYSSFIFLGITSLAAEGLNEHPLLGKGPAGFYAYSWRGFLDKTDGTYLAAWLLPSLLHEDTRFYALGHGHSVPSRALYVISRQVVARTYGGHQTPNVAGFGGKVLTQYISRFYYPSGSSDFGVLAEKFGFSVMRDVIFSTIREFYPDISAHYIRRHREKMARLAVTAPQ